MTADHDDSHPPLWDELNEAREEGIDPDSTVDQTEHDGPDDDREDLPRDDRHTNPRVHDHAGEDDPDEIEELVANISGQFDGVHKRLNDNATATGELARTFAGRFTELRDTVKSLESAVMASNTRHPAPVSHSMKWGPIVGTTIAVSAVLSGVLAVALYASGVGFQDLNQIMLTIGDCRAYAASQGQSVSCPVVVSP